MTIQEFNKTKIGVKRPPFSKEWRERIGDAQRGKKKPPRTDEHKRHISESKKGKPVIVKGTKRPLRSKEWSEKISKAKRGKMIGEKNHLWKGGITPENQKIRSSLEIKLWRKAVFERDNFTCQKTYQKGGRLVAHHINNFADFPELRTSIENGITLSKEAHKTFHKKYGYSNNTKEQILEFISERIPKK